MSRRRWLAAVLAGIFIAWGAVLLGGRLKFPYNDLPRNRVTKGPSGSQGVSLPEPSASGEVEQSSCILRVSEFGSGQSVESFHVSELRPKTVTVRVTDRDVPARGRRVFSVGKVTILQCTKEGEKKLADESFMLLGSTMELWAEIIGIPEEEIKKVFWTTDNENMKFVWEDGTEFAPGTEVTGRRARVQSGRGGETTITVHVETKEE